MATVTLTKLRLRARERADMVNSSFVTDTADSLDNWINRGLEILHQKLVDAYGEEYRESTSSFTVSGETVALPADFFKLISVELLLGSRYVDLKKYQRSEASAYRAASASGLGRPRYRLAGSNLRLLPQPATGTTGRLYYAPVATRLVNAGDTSDMPNGWEEYAAVYAAIQCLAKEESDPSMQMRELARMDAELEAIKMERDMAHPNQVTDVEADDLDPYWGV